MKDEITLKIKEVGTVSAYGKTLIQYALIGRGHHFSSLGNPSVCLRNARNTLIERARRGNIYTIVDETGLVNAKKYELEIKKCV